MIEKPGSPSKEKKEEGSYKHSGKNDHCWKTHVSNLFTGERENLIARGMTTYPETHQIIFCIGRGKTGIRRSRAEHTEAVQKEEKKLGRSKGDLRAHTGKKVPKRGEPG